MTEIEVAFPQTTELITLAFTLSLQKDANLFPDYAKGLHAWFLERVRKDDPQFSQYLHDGQSEKPFTISRLEGEMTTNGKQLHLSKENTYYWYITALSQPVAKWLQKWLTNLPKAMQRGLGGFPHERLHQEAIALYSVRLQIERVTIAHPATTYSKLFSDLTFGEALRDRGTNKLVLSFVSPTSFHKSGHHFPLPVPHNLFHSYLRRWNHFATQNFDADSFLAWIDNHVFITRHQLESVRVPGGKKGLVTGFVGAIELNLAQNSELNPEYVALYRALGKLAIYCGTGHKTTFGLGQTRAGWQVKPSAIATIATENLLAQRIEIIFESLMAKQKRVGGARATKVCLLRATIMARRETGESLKKIAEDLEIPYETAKTYLKLARRLLNS